MWSLASFLSITPRLTIFSSKNDMESYTRLNGPLDLVLWTPPHHRVRLECSLWRLELWRQGITPFAGNIGRVVANIRYIVVLACEAAGVSNEVCVLGESHHCRVDVDLQGRPKVLRVIL